MSLFLTCHALFILLTLGPINPQYAGTEIFVISAFLFKAWYGDRFVARVRRAHELAASVPPRTFRVGLSQWRISSSGSESERRSVGVRPSGSGTCEESEEQCVEASATVRCLMVHRS